MKPKIFNHYDRPTTKGEINDQPSVTVPDQSMTIRQIIERTKKGLPVTGVKVPLYNETEDGIMPNLRSMDLSEVAELKKRLKAKENEIRLDLQRQEQERQQKETEEFYKKKFAKPVEKSEVITEAEEVK